MCDVCSPPLPMHDHPTHVIPTTIPQRRRLKVGLIMSTAMSKQAFFQN